MLLKLWLRLRGDYAPNRMPSASTLTAVFFWITVSVNLHPVKRWFMPTGTSLQLFTSPPVYCNPLCIWFLSPLCVQILPGSADGVVEAQKWEIVCKTASLLQLSKLNGEMHYSFVVRPSRKTGSIQGFQPSQSPRILLAERPSVDVWPNRACTTCNAI